MNLTELHLTSYLDLLSSGEPAPGGGSASALTGAQGLALVLMVADLTTGKEKYKDSQALCLAVREQGIPLFEEMVRAVDQDTEAFNGVMAAYRLPKDTDDQKQARTAAIRAANREATRVPFHVMELALEGLKLAASLSGKSNETAASDLGVAALSLKAAADGAWLNVGINLGGIKDPELEEMYRREGARLSEDCARLAGEVLETVRASI